MLQGVCCQKHPAVHPPTTLSPSFLTHTQRQRTVPRSDSSSSNPIFSFSHCAHLPVPALPAQPNTTLPTRTPAVRIPISPFLISITWAEQDLGTHPTVLMAKGPRSVSMTGGSRLFWNDLPTSTATPQGKETHRCRFLGHVVQATVTLCSTTSIPGPLQFL